VYMRRAVYFQSGLKSDTLKAWNWRIINRGLGYQGIDSMKTKLGLLLLMLLTTVGCDDSPQTQQSTEQGFDLEGSSGDEQPDEAEQPTKPVHSDPPVVELPSITNTIGMSLNKIPAGTFLMGSPATDKGRQDDEHQHEVTITKSFYMQTTEVTQGQWKAVMDTEPECLVRRWVVS
jgi:formylglycine-generating enzyme required for sulfatase activity